MGTVLTYAGPLDSVELMVADGRYEVVRNHELSDAQANTLGLGEVAAQLAVSDELAALLDEDTWPRAGTSDDVVDEPESNPATVSAAAQADAGIEPYSGPLDEFGAPPPEAIDDEATPPSEPESEEEPESEPDEEEEF